MVDALHESTRLSLLDGHCDGRSDAQEFPAAGPTRTERGCGAPSTKRWGRTPAPRREARSSVRGTRTEPSPRRPPTPTPTTMRACRSPNTRQAGPEDGAPRRKAQA